MSYYFPTLPLYLKAQVCDFNKDCDDDSDEAECPSMFNFDEFDGCPTDNPNCFWPEMRKDGLDWAISTIDQTKSLPHGPPDGLPGAPGHFLFINDNSSLPGWGQGTGDTRYALAVSPTYRNAGPECTISLDYYIAGEVTW